MQVATLMQLQGNRADPAQLERLQFMLSEKNNEIETLMLKVRELEKEKVNVRIAFVFSQCIFFHITSYKLNIT